MWLCVAFRDLGSSEQLAALVLHELSGPGPLSIFLELLVWSWMTVPS